MSWLMELYAEQRTPDEVVVFLLLGTAAILIVSFFAYAIVLIVLSRWRMQERYSIWQLLFPSAARIRRYAAEYLLGLVTALLLALTVSIKHVAVESVLAQDIGDIGRDVIRSALPFGTFTAEELIGAGADPAAAQSLTAWLDEGVAQPIGMSAESLVRPLLVAGMKENAKLIVRESAAMVSPAGNTEMLGRMLLVTAIVLLGGYVSWFGWQRWRELQLEESAEPTYATVFKRLALPAMCIPLLFVSAAVLDAPERLVESAVGHAFVSEASADSPVAAVIDEHATRIRNGELSVDARDLESLNQNVGALARRIDETTQQAASLAGQLREMERLLGDVTSRLEDGEARSRVVAERVAGLQNDLAQAQDAAQALSERAAAVASRAFALAERSSAALGPLKDGLGDLERELRAIAGRVEQGSAYGILLVQNFNGNGSYAIRPLGESNRARPAAGTRIGIHLLESGTYVISGSGSGQERRAIAVNNAYTVQLQRVVQ